MKKIYDIDANLPKAVKYMNLLLIGVAGSGKSSFVNSCATALLDDGRLVQASLAMKAGMASATRMLKLAPLRRKGGDVIPIRLFDTRGILKEGTEVVGKEEMNYIIDGYVKPNAKMTSLSDMKAEKKSQRETPKIGDEMHCVVYVVRADKSMDDKDPCLGEIAGIRETVAQRNLPQCVLITAIDKILPNADDVGDMFRYSIVQKLCKFVSNSLKLSPGNIFPTANYVIEGVPDAVKDGISLCTLWKIVSLGIDYLNQMEGIGDNIPDDFFD
ncbi:uncharacterized protein LOC134228528 [Saccostrea cucullata]|uniref:uncharacterized protein LOC134228528 n=1 Tax=Saccostrea cuccullata TaxID=36930 RepID=UPI002ED0E58D